MSVVYFNQHLGAAHLKHWSTLLFQRFPYQKAKERKNKQENSDKLEQKTWFLSLHLNAGRSVFHTFL